MKTIRKSERGFSLVIGMSILILLTVLGIAVIQTVNSDISSSASDKQSQSALTIAEAGITWAIDYLQTQYQLNTATHQTFADIIANKKGDLTPYTGATTTELMACPSSDSCAPTTNWLVITHGRTATQTTFGAANNTYIVWVGLDPADATGNTLLLRSLGIDSNNSKRLLEVAVAAGSGQTL
jgi:Tfp pilus assembly protein PilX